MSPRRLIRGSRFRSHKAAGGGRLRVPRGRSPLQTGGLHPCAVCRVRAELAPSLPHGLGSLVTVSGLGKVAVAGGVA